MFLLNCLTYSIFIFLSLFFFNDTPTPEIYTLSLHDALPIYCPADRDSPVGDPILQPYCDPRNAITLDRKSTRLNSSHLGISYAVFCLKKKKKKKKKHKKHNKKIKQYRQQFAKSNAR